MTIFLDPIANLSDVGARLLFVLVPIPAPNGDVDGIIKAFPHIGKPCSFL